MIKKLLVIAASLISIDASAGYVQYNLSGPVSGSVVQHDDNGSIAYFNLNVLINGAYSNSPNGFRMSLTPQQSEGSTLLTSETTFFPAGSGPTNFTIYSNFGGDQVTDFAISFARAANGSFTYSESYRSSIYFSGGYQNFAGNGSGTVSLGTVSPGLVTDLDYNGGYYENVSHIIPTFVIQNNVPEPASLALFAVGGLAAFASSRRRNRKLSISLQ